MSKPLILVTNDDGIDSRGLWAAAEGLLPLGDVLVVAPDRQWSGGGRAKPQECSGALRAADREVAGRTVTAWAVDASPALAVVHGLLELVPRQPRLVVSGINSGCNLGRDVTVSGTVGAALEAAAFGIPALAVSLDMDPAYHLTGSDTANYGVVVSYLRQLAEYALHYALPKDADVLNINVPAVATLRTRWRLTRLSRQRYYLPTKPDRSAGCGRPGYRAMASPAACEPDSDIRATIVDGVVSVTPLSLDLTSRVETGPASCLCGDLATCLGQQYAAPHRVGTALWRQYRPIMPELAGISDRWGED